MGVVGCLISQQLNAKLNQRVLKQVFAVFLVLIGSFVIIREGSDLLQSASRTDETEQPASLTIEPHQISNQIESATNY